MHTMEQKHFSLLVLVISLNVFASSSSSSPLYTKSRWIVDQDGTRIKLACANWPSHLQPMVAEGLDKQPVDVISKKIREMGFNCVRLTWPLYLVTNESFANVTVRESFAGLELKEAIEGMRNNNPSFLDRRLLEAFQAVVSNLGDNDVMVILDNHLTVPGWCCARDDENGFFGDKYFDPDIWIKGLTRMATIFSGIKNVVGMSLRNELRGPRQNVTAWYKYMEQGAEAVHAANNDVLVILSGLELDTQLNFLKNKPVTLTFKDKLVYEVHLYSFTAGDAWSKGNANQICGSVVNGMMGRTGFLVQQGWPLFLSEFGLDLHGENRYDARYLSCVLGVLADLDLEWALWTLQGSYYLRQGTKNMEEVYGVLSLDWSEVRNPDFMRRIAFIQPPFQGPGLSATTYNIIYHPSTGHCIRNSSNSLKLGPCDDTAKWNYKPENIISLNEANSCLQAVGIGKPPVLGDAFADSSSKWEKISDSRMHLSSKLADGTRVCLDSDNNGAIVTNECKCLQGDVGCNPLSQWFKIINSSRNLST